jgi:hypothetical protein
MLAMELLEDRQLLSASRYDIALAITHSSENYAAFTTAAYDHYLRRLPEPAGLNSWVRAMQGGLSDEQLEANFIGSAEYIQNHGGTGEAWVQGLYRDLLGRDPDSQGLKAWLDALHAGTVPSAIAHGFAASAEREGMRIRDDYRTYLSREPEAGIVSAWVDAFLHGASNENVVAGFAASAEYYDKWGNGRPGDWLASVYKDVLHRSASDAEVQGWVGETPSPQLYGPGSREGDTAIRSKWLSLGTVSGVLGRRINNEADIRGGGGRVAEFQNGIIFWTRQTGAQEVHGDFWTRMGKSGVPVRSAEGTVWVVDASNNVYHWDASANRWSSAEAGVVNQQDGSLFFRGLSGAVYHYFTTTGQLAATSATAMALGAAEGTVWFASATHDVYHWDSKVNSWAQPMAGVLDFEDSIWFLGTTNVDGKSNHAIYRFSNGQVTQLPSSGQRLLLGGDSIWVINAANDVYRWDGNAWRMMPGAIAARWVAKGGSSGALGTPLADARSVPNQGGGQAVDFAGGVVYGLAAQGTIVALAQDGSQVVDGGAGLGLTGTPRIAAVGNEIQVVGNHNSSNDHYANYVRAIRNRDGTVTIRLTVFWVGGGFYLVEPAPQVYTKQFRFDRVHSVRIINSEGSENEAVVPAGVATSGFQRVTIAGLPGGTPQTRNTCGPNSAWRVIQSYGGIAKYQELIDRSSEGSVVSRWRLGTTGATLVDAMNSDRRGLNVPHFSLETRKGLARVVELLKQGRPIVAMERVPGTEVYKVGGAVGDIFGQIPVLGDVTSYEMPALHWIAINGFDLARGMVNYVDTDGNQYEQSYNNFTNSFNWDFGPVTNGLFQALGVVPGTLIA